MKVPDLIRPATESTILAVSEPARLPPASYRDPYCKRAARYSNSHRTLLAALFLQVPRVNSPMTPELLARSAAAVAFPQAVVRRGQQEAVFVKAVPAGAVPAVLESVEAVVELPAASHEDSSGSRLAIPPGQSFLSQAAEASSLSESAYPDQ